MRYHEYMKIYRVGICLMVIAGVLPFTASAAIPISIPFGGIITKEIPCNDGSVLLTIVGPRPGEFMLTAASLKFAWYAFLPSEWVLGIAAPVAAIPCTLGPTVVGAGLPIIMSGTTLVTPVF